MLEGKCEWRLLKNGSVAGLESGTVRTAKELAPK